MAELVESEGIFHTFDSREAAESFAADLSQGESRVRVQRVAPQDSTPVDGYLIRYPRQFHSEPKATDKPGLTFDVGANLYGELGRALIYGTYGVSPALRYYFYEKMPGVDRETHRLNRVAEPYFPDSFDGDVSWQPDVLIRTYRRATNTLDEMYFGEIKTGDASFQRGQLEDMQMVAEEFEVLKIRVDISDLPAEYTVRIERV